MTLGCMVSEGRRHTTACQEERGGRAVSMARAFLDKDEV